MPRKWKPPLPPNQLRRYRRSRHLRIVDVAKLIGLKSPAHIAHWEKGRKLPSLKNALKLSAAISCPIEVMFRDFLEELRQGVRANEEAHHIKRIYE